MNWRFWRQTKEPAAEQRDLSWSLSQGGWPMAGPFAATPQRAEGLPAVLCAVELLASTTAALPLKVYRSKPDGGREEVSLHPLAQVLRRPNPSMGGGELREWLIRSLLLHGDAIAEAVWDGRGALQALWPIAPGACQVRRLPTGRLIYDVTGSGGGVRRLLQDEVLHIRHSSVDGITGRSPLRVAAESVGLALAERDYATSFYAHSARPDVALVSKMPITADQTRAVRDAWERLHAGAQRAFRPAVIPHDMEIKTLSLSNQDAQFVESRRLTVEDVARIFNISPPLLHDLSHGTYANVAELTRSFYKLTLLPWLRRLEEAIREQLVSDAMRESLIVEHTVEGLLRGNTPERYQAYALARQWGWLSANDIRALENLPPIAGGDAYLSPLNMTPAGGEGEVK